MDAKMTRESQNGFISEGQLYRLLADASYSLLYCPVKPLLCQMLLITSRAPNIMIARNQQNQRDFRNNQTVLAAARTEMENTKSAVEQFLKTKMPENVFVTALYLNWHYIVLYYVEPEQVTYDSFKEFVNTEEQRLSQHLSKRGVSGVYVKTPAGESMQDIHRMHMDACINMEVLLFTGRRVPVKEKISERSVHGQFHAGDKRTERDYFMKLCNCDFQGAIVCLDELLEKAGYGVYKDISTFRDQLCACLELATYILGFKSGNEHILTDMIPAFARDIGKAGEGVILTKEAFREITVQQIHRIQDEIVFATNIKSSAVESAVHLIQRNYQDLQFSAQKLADQMNLPMPYLSKMFRAETNYTVSGYIRHLRIEKARELLRKTELTVSEVAEQSGFSSEKTFYRVFLDAEGITPNAYRKQVRGERNEIK